MTDMFVASDDRQDVVPHEIVLQSCVPLAKSIILNLK